MPELARAARVAHGLLDRRREHVHAADHDHVVGAPDDPAGQPAVRVAGRAALVGVHHHVAGAVAQHREAGAPQRGDHAARRARRRRRAQLVVEDLADELVLVDVQPAALRARVAERARLGQPGVVEAARAEALLDRASARPAARRPARRCRSPARPSRARPRAAARPPPRAAAARRSACTRSPSRSSSAIVCSRWTGAHAAERDGHRADLLEPLLGGPELHVRAEREGERDAVARADAGDRSACARSARATRPSPRPCRAPAAAARSCRWSGASACSGRAGR